MELAEALGAAIEAVERIEPPLDPTPLHRARQALRAPWKIVVVGRVSAGKSTLVQWLSRTAQPTGLGGVTRQIRPIPVGDLLLVDTPGIDAPDAAIVALQPLLEQADEVFWVVDALQPGTASEREVLAATVVSGTPLRVVIAKIDLVDPGERESVLERVRTLARRWTPASVTAHDLRASIAEAASPAGLLHPAPPSPRQRALVRDALAAVRASIDPGPPPLELSTVLEAWRSAVRGAVEHVEADIDAGRIQHKTDALAALGATTIGVAAAVSDVVHPLAPPPLPHPEPPAVTAIGQVLGGLSGQEGAKRVLKADAARWLAEGQLVLREWWAELRDRQHGARAIHDLDQRIEALMAAI